MSLVALTCMLVCALMGGTMCVCLPKNYTLWIEKQGCAQCVAISTTICSGFCYTQDTNVNGRVGKNYLVQRGCMPRALVYRAARLPGCSPGVNPVVYYPESVHCHCSRCHQHTHHCVRTGWAAPNRCRRRRRPAPRRRASGKNVTVSLKNN